MEKFTPVRTCAGCGAKKGKPVLLRIVRTPSGEILPDPTGRTDGRGVYLCRSEDCLKKAVRRKSLARGLRAPVPPETVEEIAKEIAEHEGA